jgi:serine/threonine protein phosphatase PrpC
MEYATAIDVGDRKRGEDINEDSVAVMAFEDGHRDGYRGRDRDPAAILDASTEQPANRSVGIFALADGAGGHDAGDVASYIASTLVVEELAQVGVRAARSDPAAFDVDLEAPRPNRLSAVDAQAAIDEAIQIAHRKILTYAETTGQAALSTVVAGILVDGDLHYGWVGDSRAYVLNRTHERIEQLTRDHSVVAELRDAGEVDQVEAHVHPRGNEITNAVGGDPGRASEDESVPVETHTVPVYAEDVLLVTSDGLIDAQTDAPQLHAEYLAADRNGEVADSVREAVVTDAEIAGVVFDEPTLQAAADELVVLANERGGKDNLSTLLLADAALPETPAASRLPTRSIDPDEDVEDRHTVIVPEEEA